MKVNEISEMISNRPMFYRLFYPLAHQEPQDTWLHERKQEKSTDLMVGARDDSCILKSARATILSVFDTLFLPTKISN